MTTSFRSDFTIKRRDVGYWQDGVYHPIANALFMTIKATVQMPSTGDMNAIEAFPYGKRASRYLKIYTDTRLYCVNQKMENRRDTYIGDLLLYDDSEYLIFGESDFTMLSRTRVNSVSHWRYYACETIEDPAWDLAP